MSEGTTVEAVEIVYRKRGRDFFRFALAVTGEDEMARDAVQEGFARAIRRRATFRGSGSLDAWLARCVMNAARDMVSARGVSAPLDDLDEGAALPGTADEELRSLVRELPPRQRAVLFLRFYLDLDYESIGETLGIEVGTVSATLHAARNALGRALQEVYE